MVRQHHQLAPDAELGKIAPRTGIADIHADHALDELRMAHRELIAVEATPVVQQEGHALAGVRLLHHVPNGLDYLIEGISALGAGAFEPGKREAHAAVAILQRRHLPIPQPIGVGPAVNHYDGAGAAALDDPFYVIDTRPHGRRCYCTVASAACQTSSAFLRTRTTLPCGAQRDSS